MNLNNVVMRNKYITIIERIISGRKTPIYTLMSNYSESEIAQIRWFPKWRKYCFYPNDDTVYDEKCLRTIQSYLHFLNFYKSKLSTSVSNILEAMKLEYEKLDYEVKLSDKYVHSIDVDIYKKYKIYGYDCEKFLKKSKLLKYGLEINGNCLTLNIIELMYNGLDKDDILGLIREIDDSLVEYAKIIMNSSLVEDEAFRSVFINLGLKDLIRKILKKIGRNNNE